MNVVATTRGRIDAALAHLTEYGVDCTVRIERSPLVWADATVALRLGGSHQRFSVYAMPAIRLVDVLTARDEAAHVLVIASWVSPRIGRELRRADICYLDAVGNASVRFGTVLIEVSGRPRPPRGSPAADPLARGRGTATLLTPANRKVIAALLADPAVGEGTLRDLAAEAGVSLGQAHKASALLANAGFHRDRLSEDQRGALAQILTAVDRLGRPDA